jgi:hypothetical protein
MTPFGQPWSTLGQTLVKDPLNTLGPFYVSRNFCCVLQISPKHFKISQCKSCVSCRGTQLSCWVALEIWSGNAWKILVNAEGYYSLAPKNLHLGMRFVHNRLRKIPHGLCRSCSWSCDLQLWLLALCALKFENLEKFAFEQGCTEQSWRRTVTPQVFNYRH